MADAGPLAGRRILMLPRYSQSGPSSRLRMGQFVPALEAAGATIETAPFFDEAYLAGYFAGKGKSAGGVLRGYARRLHDLATRRADIAWVEKELFPFLPGVTERALAVRGIPYTVDYDDAIFHSYDGNRRGLVRTALGGKLDPLLRGSAAVTAGNGYLAEYATRHGATRVIRVPTVVDPRRYPVLPRPEDGRLRVGWIGTPANARYLAPVIAAMARLAAPVTLVTIGADPIPDLPFPQETHPWSEDTEAALLTTIDIGVMPLPDDPFERGKCGYKLIQYMAAGRPVIASPVGVNAEIVDAGVGFLADTGEQWVEALSRLMRSADLRMAMGAAGRAKVEAHYSIDAVTPTLIALFASIADAR